MILLILNMLETKIDHATLLCLYPANPKEPDFPEHSAVQTVAQGPTKITDPKQFVKSRYE